MIAITTQAGKTESFRVSVPPRQDNKDHEVVYFRRRFSLRPLGFLLCKPISLRSMRSLRLKCFFGSLLLKFWPPAFSATASNPGICDFPFSAPNEFPLFLLTFTSSLLIFYSHYPLFYSCLSMFTHENDDSSCKSERRHGFVQKRSSKRNKLFSTDDWRFTIDEAAPQPPDQKLQRIAALQDACVWRIKVIKKFQLFQC